MSKSNGLLLIFCLLLLSGCQAPAAIQGEAVARPTLTPTNIPLTLKPCIVADGGIKAECGDLFVPEDRTHPNGRILDLKLIVVRAHGASSRQPDPLFYLTGGPGVPATSTDVVMSANTYLWGINTQRDIVFLDQRGTNDKHRLTCEVIPFNLAAAPQQQVNDYVKKCLSTVDGDPRFYMSAEFIRDVDAARAALGYDKINFYGISYGAAAIQVYMRMFPEHYRAAVIDHGTALDLPFVVYLPRASQSALDQVFTYCEQDETCRTAYPNVRSEWKAVLDRLAKGPVVTSYTPPGASQPAEISMDAIASGIHNLLFKSGTYALIPSLIHALATQQDWASIAITYGARFDEQPQRLLLMKEELFCFEPAWGHLGHHPDDLARLNAGSYFTDLEIKIAQGQQKLCAALPKPDPSLIYGPGQPAPLGALMFNSLLDPQNPPSNQDLALKEFTKSRVITEPTEGHDASGSMCRWNIATEYIQKGSVDGLDVSCMAQQKPSFVIQDW